MASVGHSRAPRAVRVRDDYLAALLEGDVHRARSVAESALRTGLTMQELYLLVFQEALHEIGRLWQIGEATVAQEHLATATTQALMARLGAGAGAWVGEPAGLELRAITTATENDLHGLASRFVADFLEADGWTVIELGAATPTDDLARMVDQLQPLLICLSTTLTANLPAARAAVAAVRKLASPPLIAVGGQAYAGDELLARTVGADLFAADAGTFLRMLRGRVPHRVTP